MLMTWRLMISNKERAVATSLAQALVMRDQRYLHAKIYWQVINFCDFLGLLHSNYDKDIPNLQNVSQDLTGEYLAYLFSTCQCMARSSNPFFHFLSTLCCHLSHFASPPSPVFYYLHISSVITFSCKRPLSWSPKDPRHDQTSTLPSVANSCTQKVSLFYLQT